MTRPSLGEQFFLHRFLTAVVACFAVLPSSIASYSSFAQTKLRNWRLWCRLSSAGEVLQWLASFPLVWL